MRRQVTDGLIIATVLVLGASQLGAQGVASRKVVRANQAGGITGSAAHAVRGPNGGGMVGGRAVVTDGSGNAAGGSAWNAARTLTKIGNTTYDQGSGVTHTGTCTNAAGEVVACAK